MPKTAPAPNKTRSSKAAPGPGDLRSLLPSWDLSLDAANKSPRTIETYVESGRQLTAFLVERGMPTEAGKVCREHVEAWVVMLTKTRSPSTASVRFRAVQQLFKWLVDEGECETSPVARMRPPTIPEQPVPVVDAEALSRLYKACQGTTFTDRRDLAIIRFLADTGCRRAEVVGLRLDDVDLKARTATVTGKGSRTADVAFSSETALVLDKYRRARAKHTRASSPAWWLGKAGPLKDSGLAQLVRRRGIQAGIEGLHPHQLRHSWASAQHAAGMSDVSIMALAGWKSRAMLNRYGSADANKRAIAEAHRIEDAGR